MANSLTAIELGLKTLSAVTARVNGQGPQIVSAGSSPLAGTDPESIRAALSQCGAEGLRAMLVLPRGQSILRDLELPEGSPEELVSMVRFQMERDLPLPLDQVRFSYIETGREGGKVRIQVAACPRDVIDPAIAALEGAGWKVSGATLSSYGLLALCPEGEPVVLVEVAAGEAEILVADGGRMLFSRTAPLPDGPSPDAIAEEIGRTLLAWSARAPGREVRRVLLAGEGPEAVALAADIGARLSRNVDPVGPGDLETAPAAGLCLGLLRGRLVPDLLHPPTALKKYHPTRNHRIIALSAAILLMLGVWSQVALADKRDALKQRQQKLGELEPKAAALLKTQQQTEIAHQWYRKRNLWVPTLTSLRKYVRTDNLWIASASFDDAGLVRIQGKTKDDSHVHALVTALTASGQFEDVNNHGSHQNSDKGDYKRDFSLTAHLKGSRPVAPAAGKPVAPRKK